MNRLDLECQNFWNFELGLSRRRRRRRRIRRVDFDFQRSSWVEMSI